MSKSKTAAVCLATWLALVLAVSQTSAQDKKPAPEKDAGDIDYVETEVPDEPTKPPIGRNVPPPPPDAVAGFLELSNGDRVEGRIHLTRDAVLKFSHLDPDGKNRILTFRLQELLYLEQRPIKEFMEKEWRWLENANDQKVYTGREYPMRELDTVVHPRNGPALTGKLVALLFVANENGSQRFVLHKRQKGKPGTTLKDLLYVRLVDLRPPEKSAPKEPPAEEK